MNLFAEDGAWVLRWQSQSGHVYRVERSTNPQAGFSPTASDLPAPPPENAYGVDSTKTKAMFYGIRAGGE